MRPEGIQETCLYADDLPAAEQFYTRVLGLDVMARESGRHVFLRCGEGVMLIFNPQATSSEQTFVEGAPVPLHGARGAGHLAFRVAETELENWRQQLRDSGVAIESEVRWPQGGRSLYFRDPAGNSVELVTPQTWGLR
jgi:catechol 2,3-dioxygenase-like lactoylglutathione lyase family enzyme